MGKALLATLLFGLLATSAAARAQPPSPWTEEYSRLLGKYVTPNGVRYAAWHGNAADRAALGRVVAAIAQEKPGAGREAKLAFYVNAYNANILAAVLEKYPLRSVRDIAPLFGVFTQPRITVSGERMSFNHLEKDLLLSLKEPRVHFALNCASASCPPLRNAAYTAAKLDAELEQGTTAFLNQNPRGVAVSDGGKRAAVSKIFDWNAKDFQAAGGVLPFVNRYRKPPLPDDAKVSYQEYDWSLNAAN